MRWRCDVIVSFQCAGLVLHEQLRAEECLNAPDDFENDAEYGEVEGVGVHAPNFQCANEEDVNEDTCGVPREELSELQRHPFVSGICGLNFS